MSNDRHRDNPAGRLYLVLNAVWKAGKTEKSINAWKKALKVEGSEMATFLARISTVYKLPGQIRDLVPEVPALTNLSTIPGALGKVESVLSEYHTGAVQRFQDRLTSNTLDTLQAISAILSTSAFAEPVLEDEFLERVRTEISALYEEIQKAPGLPPDERFHLLNLLDLLSNAVVEVDIGGAEVLRSAANEVAGAMLSEFPMAGPSRWRDLLASLALGIAVNIGSAVVTDHVLPPVDSWVSQMPIFQLEASDEAGEETKEDDDEEVETAEVVEEGADQEE